MTVKLNEVFKTPSNDVERPVKDRSNRRFRRVFSVAIILSTIATISLLILRSPAPVVTIERSQVWIDTVKRSNLIRQVRGTGTLVPENIVWIASRTEARVDSIKVFPGALVEPDTIILELKNPALVQVAAEAESRHVAAEAEYTALKASLESDVLSAEAALVEARATREQANLRAEVNEMLFKQGNLSDLERRLSSVSAEQAELRFQIEQKRYLFMRDSVAPQLLAKSAAVQSAKAIADLRKEEIDSLHVRAGLSGVLQVLPVEIGAQVQAGENLARVANPTRLKAVVKIPEFQARDLATQQRVVIDTRQGICTGEVKRIDPSVREGTVTVEVELTSELPRGARPDLSIEGVIELERLENVLCIGRPALGQERIVIPIYRLEADGVHAQRTSVSLGSGSVNAFEILDGLAEGDRVILSDLTQFEAADRIKIK